MSENNGNSMVVGLLLGAAVGAGLALLFAPMSGDETRRRIGARARNLKEGSLDRMDNMAGIIKERAGELGAAIDAGRSAFRRTADGTAGDKGMGA